MRELFDGNATRRGYGWCCGRLSLGKEDFHGSIIGRGGGCEFLIVFLRVCHVRLSTAVKLNVERFRVGFNG